MTGFFEPKEKNKDQQDASGLGFTAATTDPNPIVNTVKGGSANPGSAIAGTATRAQAGNVSSEGSVSPGFVGTRTIPGTQS